jgi:hypothetical protein
MTTFQPRPARPDRAILFAALQCRPITGRHFPIPRESQLFFPALTSPHPEDGILLPYYEGMPRDASSARSSPKERSSARTFYADASEDSSRARRSPGFTYASTIRSIAFVNPPPCKLAFIGKTRSRWVGAGVTVGEGYRDYDRDRDRTVVKEREPFERYWHSKGP